MVVCQPPFLPFFHPPIELASFRPRGRLHLDRWIDFSAICFGTLLDLIVAEIPYLIQSMFSNREEFGMASSSQRENREIEAANASGNTPVVFIHGLWLLPSSWEQLGRLLQRGRFRAAHPGLAGGS